MQQSQRHSELVNLLVGYNFAYYVNNESPVPDAVYDRLFREIKDLEIANPELITPASPTQTVGFLAKNHFTKVKHPYPMLSLGNSLNPDELIAWINNLPLGMDYFIELKLDGVSLELLYNKGILIQAVTRGDGNVGEDVTLNAMEIDCIPKKIKYNDCKVLVRGEVVVQEVEFERVNRELLAAGKKTYVNKRNYASGALRQKNPKVTGERGLEFIAYHFDILNETKFYVPTTGLEARTVMDDQDFYLSKSFESCQLRNTDEAQLFLDAHFRMRHDWGFDIDGLVFKVNKYSDREELGYNSHEPKWATAYKFPASEGVSKLEGITLQVGRTGQLTPVAEITPVFIHGTTISRVTLHNLAEIRRLSVNVGCDVVVKRAGDVIPKIIQAVQELSDDQQWVHPDTCPCCGNAIAIELDAKEQPATLFCINQECPDRVKAHLQFAASRGVYNILGLGTETISDLYNVSGFKSHRDHIRLLWLTKEQLMETGLSEHVAEKLVEVVTKARVIQLDRLIASFGIPGASEGTSDRLASHFGSLEKIVNASIEELLEVDKVGPGTAASVFEFFDTYKAEGWYAQWVDKLTIVNPEPRSTKLKGQSVMITGSKFGEMNRKGITAYYKTLSASVTSNVTKNTALALFGTSYTEHKLETAKQLGIPYKIFDENGVIEEFTGNATVINF